MKRLIYLIAPLMCVLGLTSCGGNSPVPPEVLYKVTFVNDDGTTLLDEIDEVKAGEHITYSGDEPTSTNIPRESHYFEFDGFKDDNGVKLDDNYLMPSHNVVFTAQYLELGDLHTVNWVNYDGEALSDTEVNYESHPIYQGETPTKPGDDYSNFEFIGWIDEDGVEYSDDYIMPNHDITLTAKFGDIAKDGFIYELSKDGTYYINCGLIDKTFAGELVIKPEYRELPVKEIKAHSFEKGLFERVYTENAVETIGERAFYGCQNLKLVVIGEKVNTIGDKAFYNCKNIEEYNVVELNEAYEGNSVLIETQSKKLLYAGKNRYSEIPNGVKIIGSESFKTYIDESVRIPNSVEIIENKAFYGCINLRDVDLNDNNSALTEIGESAFEGCVALRRFIAPKSLLTISDNAFKGCIALEQFYFAASSLTTIGKYAFNGCNKINTLQMPATLTYIGDYAFGGCDNLRMVDLLFSDQAHNVGINIFGHKDSGSFAIYVKSAVADQYQAADGWSTYADFIVGY